MSGQLDERSKAAIRQAWLEAGVPILTEEEYLKIFNPFAVLTHRVIGASDGEPDQDGGETCAQPRRDGM